MYHAASLLRLRSFLYGGCFVNDEHGIPLHPTALPASNGKLSSLQPSIPIPNLDLEQYGSFCRVLAQDSVTGDLTVKRILGIDHANSYHGKRFDDIYVVEVLAKSVSVVNGRLRRRELAVAPSRSRKFSLFNMLDGWSDPFLVPVDRNVYQEEVGAFYDDDSDETPPVDPGSETRPAPKSVRTRIQLRFKSLSESCKVTRSVLEALMGATVSTTIVFRPPMLKQRIFAMLYTVWAFSLLLHGTALFGSVFVGRVLVSVIRTLFSLEAPPANDVANFSFGFVTLYGSLYGAQWLSSNWSSLFDRSWADSIVTIRRWILAASKICYFSFMLFGIGALFVGLLFDAVILHPVNLLVSIARNLIYARAQSMDDVLSMIPESLELTRVVNVFTNWSFGLLFMPLIWHVLALMDLAGMLRDAPYLRKVMNIGTEIRNLRLSAIRPSDVHQTVLPFAAVTMAFLLSPVVLSTFLIDEMSAGLSGIFLHNFFHAALAIHMSVSYFLYSHWTAMEAFAEQVRESEYRVGYRLHNVEDPQI